jgi:cytoskeleton protein RodZ
MAEIGYRLVRAREARGLTLEDAERDTRISRRYLEALEDEQFERIPAPVYARGFLRSYAQYLGMDPQELLALFPRGDEPRSPNGTPAEPPPQASMRTPIPATSPSRPTWRKPPRFDSGKTARTSEPRRRREPPNPRGAAPAQPASGDFVIGGGDAPAPQPQQQPRRAATPQLTTRGTSPAARRQPSRTVVAEPVIGADPSRGPARRLERSTGDGQRNLVVIISAVGVLAVVVVAAIAIAMLGGGDGETPGSPTPTGTSSSTAEGSGTAGGSATASATASATGAAQGTVPNVEGIGQSEAEDLIEDAGLTVRVLTQPDAAPEGIVITQSPAAGQVLQPGSEVTIVVSEGQ